MPDVTIDDNELANLRTRAEAADSAAAAAETAQRQATELQTQLTAGIERFRETVRAQHADIPAEHIDGDTFDAVAQSAARARAIADAALAAQPPRTTTAPTVPAGGAATRDQAPATDGMSPAQKVRAGLLHRSQQTS